MKRQHKSRNMSHFLLSVPVEMHSLTVGKSMVVVPVSRPELGFRFRRDNSRGRGWFDRNVEEAVEAFMSIKTYEDALAVFSVYGSFNDPDLGGRDFTSFAEVQNYVRAAWKVRTSSLAEIRHWHKQRWFSYADAPVPPEMADVWPGIMGLTVAPTSLWISLDDPPRLELRPPEYLLEALLSVLHLEKLQGLRHKYCALPDCRKPFELKGDKDKKFCSYECSHKSAVRASRTRAKEARAKKSAKRSTKGR